MAKSDFRNISSSKRRRRNSHYTARPTSTFGTSQLGPLEAQIVAKKREEGLVGSDFAGDFERNLGAVDIKNGSGPVACRRQQFSKIEHMDGRKNESKHRTKTASAELFCTTKSYLASRRYGSSRHRRFRRANSVGY